MSSKFDPTEEMTTLLFDKKQKSSPKKAIADQILVHGSFRPLTLATNSLLNSQDPAYTNKVKPNF